MTLHGAKELEATRKKLRLLQDHYQSRLCDESDNTYARELSLRSLKRMINQLTEEIARYEAHAIKR
jgi:hypothetical protein